jgi:hypothetical protein
VHTIKSAYGNYRILKMRQMMYVRKNGHLLVYDEQFKVYDGLDDIG